MEKENKKINLICKARLDKYRTITTKALSLAKKAINQEKKAQAQEIISMVEAYVGDAAYFEKQGNLVNAFAAINYAHGWLDCGARLGIFKVKNNKLFTIE